MPKTLDLVLGIAAVMLLLSLAVTALTHYVVRLCNLRGRHLRDGLAALVGRLDSRIGLRHGRALATAILKDPLICGAGGQMAEVIHRSQLTRLCLSLAAEGAGGGPGEALREALHAQGIAHPAATLERIGRHALELEQGHPELTELARYEMAVAAAAEGPFVARIHTWFDQTMDRVSARFTASVRVITVAVALGLASFLQIDCLALINQLAMDGTLHTQPVKTGGGGAHAVGIVLTAMLLSLGAPFWYGLLSGAIRLRPLTPAREDRERRVRRVTSWPASSTRLPESDEWLPVPESRYSAGRR